MRVKFISTDQQLDPLIKSEVIPIEYHQLLLSCSEHSFYHSTDFQYLEQCYYSRDCFMSFLTLDALNKCGKHPVADEAMLVFVYVQKGHVRARVDQVG